MRDSPFPASSSVLTVADDLDREFEMYLRESSTLAFRVAFGVLRHREDSEDVAQEALTNAYRNFRQLRDRVRFRAWLVRIVWRLAINRQRSDHRRRLRESEKTPEAVAVDADERLLNRERAQQLWTAIDALPDKLRVAVVLAGIEEHDTKEVALLLGLPEGTVKSRLFLARQRLRESLKWMNAKPTAS